MNDALYRLKPTANPDDLHNQGKTGKLFRKDAVYSSSELGDTRLDYFDDLGLAPPQCDDIQSLEELSRKSNDLRAWLGEWIARKREWDLIKTKFETEVRHLVNRAVWLGRDVRPDFTGKDMYEVLVVLNGVVNWCQV